jgi:hypothetical protein
MMKAKIWSLTAVVVLMVGVFGCASGNSPDGRDQGNVILSITDFDGLPIQASVNLIAPQGFLQIGRLTISNIAADPTGTTSTLMNVEIERYEVGFTRADRGTKTPQPTVRGIFGIAPVNGTIVFDNLPIMSAEEFVTQPLSDLLLQNGGIDKETGSEVILLNLEIKFYGRTLGGDRVETQTAARFTIQFVK